MTSAVRSQNVHQALECIKEVFLEPWPASLPEHLLIVFSAA